MGRFSVLKTNNGRTSSNRYTVIDNANTEPQEDASLESAIKLPVSHASSTDFNINGNSILLLQLRNYLQFHQGRMLTMVEGDGDSKMIQLCIDVWQSTTDKLRSKIEEYDSLQLKYNELHQSFSRLDIEKSSLEVHYQKIFGLFQRNLTGTQERVHNKLNSICSGQERIRSEIKEQATDFVDTVDILNSEFADFRKEFVSFKRKFECIDDSA